MAVKDKVLRALRYGLIEPSKQEPRVLLLALSTMFMTMGQGIVSPILPLLVKSFGMTAAMVGIAVSAFAIARVFANIPAGLLTKFRGAKFVLATGAFLSAGSNFLIGLIPDFTALVVLRFIAGLGSAMFITAAVIFVAEVSTPQNRGRLMSLYQTGFLLGISMGPAVGGICAALFGLASPFFLVGIVSMFSGIWTIARIPASVARGPGAGQPKQAGSVGAQASKPAQPYLFSAGFIAISLIALATFFTRGGALFNLWPLLSTERYGLGPGAIGALFMIPSVVNLALQPFVGTLADRLGRKVMLAPTMFLFSAGLAISALVPYLWAFAIGLALYGIAQAVEGPTANSYVADTAPPQQRAMALSVFRTVADVGLMVGSPGLGLIADTQGLNAGLLANAAVVLGPGVLFLLVAKDSVPRKAPQTAAAGSGGGQRG